MSGLPDSQSTLPMPSTLPGTLYIHFKFIIYIIYIHLNLNDEALCFHFYLFDEILIHIELCNSEISHIL